MLALHGGDLDSAKHKYGDLNFLDFSANINPLGPPPGVFTAIAENMAQIIHYPDPQGRRLKSVLSTRLGMASEQIILSNGAVELIYLLAHALKPKQALIPAPAFGEYARAVQAGGGVVRYKYLESERGFRLELTEADFRDCDIFFLCNPHNPTGSFLSEEDFSRILAMARNQKVFVVVDESFIDFVESREQWRAYQFLQEYDRLFILYSLTKFYAIPGLRLGCGIGSPQLIKRLENLKDPWNVNNLALAAGEAALLDEEFPGKTRQIVSVERTFLATELAKLPGLQVYPASANFILFATQGKLKGDGLVDVMGQTGILLRSCSNFPGLGDNFFRVAVKDRQSNLKLLTNLRAVL